MRALGRFDDLDMAADLIVIDEVLHPHPEEAAVYRALLPVFASLHDALLPANRALRSL